MDPDAFPVHLSQPALFDLAQVSTQAVELFPAVWNAAEGLAASEAAQRHAALDRLLDLDAARISPLVAYLLTTRLNDPDLALRMRIVRVLGDLLLPDSQGALTPDEVRRYVVTALAQMRTRSIFSLLQVISHESSLEEHVARLLNASPFAGGHLIEILADRDAPPAIRIQAAGMIGRVGYLDAIPALERLAARLEARQAGQQAMPFAPPSSQDEAGLLPAIRQALAALLTP